MKQPTKMTNAGPESAKLSIPQTIRAVGFNHFGGPEVLEEVEIARPEIKAEQVLIKVAAAGVNQGDWRFRNGQFRFFMSKKRPFIPGSDVAGIVAEAGEGVTRVKPGQAVYAMLPTARAGGYSEYVAIDQKNIAFAPATLTLAEAAAVPLAALTALQALRDKARLQPGARVLIYGASGGVGTFAVQIAKILGASVTAVCSGANTELIQRLGADEVIDYTSENFATRQDEYDVIFDAIGSYSLGQVRKALRPKGVLVSVNPVRGNPLVRFFASLRGSKQIASVFVRPSGDDLETLRNWFDCGKMGVILDKQYALSDAGEAQRYSETLRVRGKLVLIVDPQMALEK